MGSVKDFVVIRKPTVIEMGEGNCVYSKRYSVFDWVKKRRMPDEIPYSDAARCMIAAYLFERLGDIGIPTHYEGLVTEDGSLVFVADAKKPLNTMRVKLVNVYEPEVDDKEQYDYSLYEELAEGENGNFLIPAELIYRNSVPKGSSVFNRLEEGSLTLASMGLKVIPAEYQHLATPFYDISTKYEKTDRYPDERRGEGFNQFLRDYAFLSPSEIRNVRRYLHIVSGLISAAVLPLRNDDGKAEMALTPDRKVMVADALATPDECRFTYLIDGVPVDLSKEAPRQWYRTNDNEWVAEMSAAKKAHPTDWHDYVEREPKKLPHEILEMVGHLYAATTNVILGREVFEGVPTIDEIAKEYKRYREAGLV